MIQTESKECMPPIHLWTYNHPVIGIVDQIEYVIALFKQYYGAITVGQRPHPHALNIVIENFSAKTTPILLKFCKNKKKKVAVIMTEHIDYDKNTQEILMHGQKLGISNDYMNPFTQVARIRYLMECIPYIHAFFVLGDLPVLNHFEYLLPGINVIHLPFPAIEKITCNAAKPKYDFLFTGNATKYRLTFMQKLHALGVQVYHPGTFVSVKKRDRLMQNAKIILNFPQNLQWKWLSPLRILAALRIGRGTISVGTKDISQTAQCCIQVEDVAEASSLLKNKCNDWIGYYETCFAQYAVMTQRFEESYPFPYEFFSVWSMMEL